MDIANYIAEKGAQVYSLLLCKTYPLISHLKEEIPRSTIESGMLAQHPFPTMSLCAVYKLRNSGVMGRIKKKASAKTAGKNLEEDIKEET